MATFDYAGYFRGIEPLADLLRQGEERVWRSTAGKNPPSAEYVLYLGCNVLRTVNLAETIVAVLGSMGVDFITLGGPASCCGIVHERNGEMEASHRFSAHTFGNMTKFQPKGVLVYCPSCHSRMDRVILEGVPLDIPYQHVTRFIVEHLDKLRHTTPVNRRIALHSHGTGTHAAEDGQATRRILSAVPGLEVVEIQAGEEWGFQCSPTEIARMGRDAFDQRSADLFRAAQAQGADALTTVYHSCYRELCVKEAALGLEVLNYIELVALGLGMEPHPPSYKHLSLERNPARACEELSQVAVQRGVSRKKLEESLHSHFGNS